MTNDMYQDGRYIKNNPDYHASHAAWKAGLIANMMAEGNLAPRSVCEVGCGAGHVLRTLSEKMSTDIEFVGYDISPHAIELCVNEKNLRFVHGDFLESNEPEFDVLLAIDVLEHVEDCRGFSRKLQARARYKIFHIPLELSAQTVLRGTPLMHAWHVVGHIHKFTKDTALATLTDTGHTIKAWQYTDLSQQTGEGLRSIVARIPQTLCGWISPDLSARAFGGVSLLVLTE